MGDIEPLVALQADQVGLEGLGYRGGQRRLAHARLPLQEQRTPQPKCQEQRYGQAAVGDVAARGQPLLQVRDGARVNGRVPSSLARLRLGVTAEYTLRRRV